MSTQEKVKYDDVDREGANYASLLSARKLQIEAEQQALDVKRQDQEAISRQFKVQSVKFVLDRLKAKAVLQAVRDEVWLEGEIVDVEGEILLGPNNKPSYRAGISLVSDPFPLIMVRGGGYDRSLTVLKDEGHLSLDVIVTLWRDNKGEERTGVSVQDRRYCLITKSEAPDLKELIKGKGLDGLYVIQQGDNQFGGLDYSLDPGNPDVYRAFCHSVRSSVDARREYRSLPGQLRSWSGGLIGQFPPMLEEKGSIDYPPLRAWEHEIRGSNRIVVLGERLLRRFA